MAWTLPDPPALYSCNNLIPVRVFHFCFTVAKASTVPVSFLSDLEGLEPNLDPIRHPAFLATVGSRLSFERRNVIIQI